MNLLTTFDIHIYLYFIHLTTKHNKYKLLFITITDIWTKNNWTVRLDKNIIEVFNNPDKSIGKYYINSIDKIDIEALLIEIDKHND